MKWFLKCLRHYSDFSGRASRREYWMFQLFALLIFIVLLLVMNLIIHGLTTEIGDLLYLTAYYFTLVILPAGAVGVRRLHDLGRSGWAILIALIPLVGAIGTFWSPFGTAYSHGMERDLLTLVMIVSAVVCIGGGVWLTILLATKGESGTNRFGPDSKTTPEIFPEPTRLTSAGITAIVAASIWLVGSIYFNVILKQKFANFYLLVSVVESGLLLAAGILLTRSGTRKKVRSALWLLLGVTAVGLCLNISKIVQGRVGYEWNPDLSIFFNKSLAFNNAMGFASSVASLFAFVVQGVLFVTLLFAPRRHGWIRRAVLVVVALWGLVVVSDGAAWMVRIIVTFRALSRLFSSSCPSLSPS